MARLQVGIQHGCHRQETGEISNFKTLSKKQPCVCMHSLVLIDLWCVKICVSGFYHVYQYALGYCSICRPRGGRAGVPDLRFVVEPSSAKVQWKNR